MDTVEIIAIIIIGILCIYNAINIGYNMGKSTCNDIEVNSTYNSSYTQLNISGYHNITKCMVVYTDDIICYGGE